MPSPSIATPLDEYSQSTRCRPGIPGARTRRPTNQRSGTEKYSVISKPLSQRLLVISCSTGRRGQPEGRGGGLEEPDFDAVVEAVAGAAATVLTAAPIVWPEVFTGWTTLESEPHPATATRAMAAAASSAHPVLSAS